MQSISALKKILFLLPLALAWSAAPALAQTPAQLAAQVQQRYKTVTAIQASYQRHSNFVATGGQAPRVVQGSGILTWARPLSLRLDQTTPRQELIVVSPQGVWWARPKRKRADRYSLQHFTSGLKPLLDALGGLADIDQDFDLQQPTPDQKKLAGEGPVLVLIPRQRRVDLKQLAIWFHPQTLLLKGFKITSLMGDTTRYDFTTVTPNPTLKPNIFTYAPPPHYKIRDHRPRQE